MKNTAPMATRAHGNPVLLKAEQAFQRRDYRRCIEFSCAFLRKQPRHPRALRLNAYSCMETGEHQQALVLLEQILAIAPDDAQSRLNAAKLHLRAAQWQLALNHLQAFLELQPDHPAAGMLLGECLTQLKRSEEALQVYNRLIEKNPQSPEPYYKLAVLLQKMQQPETAQELLDLGIALMPNHKCGLAHLKAMLLRNQGMHGAALAIFEELESSADYDLACEIDHAHTLKKLKKYQLAIEKYDCILEKSPNNRLALLGKAGSLAESMRYDEALEICLKIHEESPEDNEVIQQIAGLYAVRRNHVQASRFYKMAFDATPEANMLAGSYLYAMSYLCDWQDYAAVTTAIDTDLSHERVRPFPSVVFVNNPEANLVSAAREIKKKEAAHKFFEAIPKYSKKEKIKIGYYSSDFFAHATVMLIEGMLREQDRTKFEIHAFSLDLTPPDASNKRIREYFDYYHDVSGISDNAVTFLSRKHEIDIAIDLKGFTQGNRTAIFSERAAPIQINYLGFPGTMGAPFIDYMVADHYTITPENRDFFSEKIIYMPACYQANNPQRPKPVANAERPSELPEGAFVYCSFNNIYKLTPTMFDLWLNILRQTPNSVLWMLRSTKEAEINLRNYVEKTDVDPARIIFAPIVPEAQHLQRVSFADCFLDSFPCNAHTTASDALWAGVPLITKSGKTFASRVAGSILTTVGLPELIVDNDADYEALALRVYNNRSYLQDLKRRVKIGIESGPLYDSTAFSRHFERALKIIYDRHHNDQSNIDVDLLA